MTPTQENIMTTLSMLGITDATLDSVYNDFASDPELAALIAGKEGDDKDRAIVSGLSVWMTKRGTAGAPTNPIDPTRTENASQPVAPQPDRAAIMQALTKNRAMMERNSRQTKLTGVLIQRPWPGEWMAGIPELPVKGDAAKVLEDLKAKYQPNVPLAELLAREGNTSFIPSTEQLAQLAQQHEIKHANDKVKRAAPLWKGAPNSELFEDVVNRLQAGALFTPLVAPKTDEGEGINKVKAWRYRTVGYRVDKPADVAGAETMESVIMPFKQLEAYVLTNTAGVIEAGPNEMGVVTRVIEPKGRKRTQAGKTQGRKSTIRVTNNNSAKNPNLVVEPIQRPEGNTAHMTVKSTVFFYIVRVDGTDKDPRITKYRLSLDWGAAPTFELQPEFAGFSEFQKKAKGVTALPTSEKDLEKIYDAQYTYAADLLSRSRQTGVAAPGFDGLIADMEDAIAQANAAKAEGYGG